MLDVTLDTFGERSYYNAAGQKSREAYLARHPLTAQNDRRDIGSKHSADKAVKTGLNYYNDVSHSAKHLLPTHHLGGPEVGAYHRVTPLQHAFASLQHVRVRVCSTCQGQSRMYA